MQCNNFQHTFTSKVSSKSWLPPQLRHARPELLPYLTTRSIGPFVTFCFPFLTSEDSSRARSFIHPNTYQTEQAARRPTTISSTATMTSSSPTSAAAQIPPITPADVPPRARRSHSTDSSILERSKDDYGFLTTPSQEEEISTLLEKIQMASHELHENPEKKEQGPFCLGWIRADQFERLEDRLRSAWRLSWGLSPDMDEAVRIEEGQGAFGQVLYWSDSSAPHERCIAWLADKVFHQLMG